MKSVFLLSLMSLTSFTYAATAEWKVVAESTTNCKEKVQVLAKEGEKFVFVTEGGTKTKLAAEDGSAYSDQSGKAVVFSNEKDQSLSAASKRFTFTNPAMVDGNPPKINVSVNGVKDNCKLNLK